MLIVEDDPQLNALLQTHLGERYEVLGARSVAEARTRIQQRPPQLILLDLNLPDGDGLVFMEELRRFSNTPALMITARGSVQDRVRGLNSGADDYLTKPFSLEELDARVKALLRRSAVGESSLIALGETELNLSNLTLRQGEQEIPLTEHEARLLGLMMRTPGRVFSRGDLESHLYGWEVPTSNSIEVRVSQLRKKLQACSSRLRIRNIRGIGYALSSE